MTIRVAAREKEPKGKGKGKGKDKKGKGKSRENSPAAQQRVLDPAFDSCKNFVKDGKCDYGTECRFLHKTQIQVDAAREKIDKGGKKGKGKGKGKKGV